MSDPDDDVLFDTFLPCIPTGPKPGPDAIQAIWERAGKDIEPMDVDHVRQVAADRDALLSALGEATRKCTECCESWEMQTEKSDAHDDAQADRIRELEAERDELLFTEKNLLGRLQRAIAAQDKADAERDALTARCERLRVVAESLCIERYHDYCDDPWYSCPKHPDGCADVKAGNTCRCGADEWNAMVTTARIVLKEGS